MAMVDNDDDDYHGSWRGDPNKRWSHLSRRAVVDIGWRDRLAAQKERERFALPATHATDVAKSRATAGAVVSALTRANERPSLQLVPDVGGELSQQRPPTRTSFHVKLVRGQDGKVTDAVLTPKEAA